MAGQGQPVTSQVARRTRKVQFAVAIRMVYVYILGMVVVAVIARRAGVDQIVPSHSATKLEAWSVVARHKARQLSEMANVCVCVPMDGLE